MEEKNNGGSKDLGVGKADVPSSAAAAGSSRGGQGGQGQASDFLRQLDLDQAATSRLRAA